MTARDRSLAETEPAPVAAYKTLLREMVDRRPSGTRQKIARAIGKHKSFVSQITNPAYPMPVPAKHLATIFELCHCSQEERRTLLAAYERAHPGRSPSFASESGSETTTISVEIPVLRDPKRQADLINAIRSVTLELSALAEKLDDENDTGDTR